MANPLLQAPSSDAPTERTRQQSFYNPLHTFDLPNGPQKHYQQQYADLYFLRLAKLKPVVEKIAAEAWNDFEIGGTKAQQVERVLDVRQGELCWFVGTIFMEMPLKPNVLDDISKDHWIAAPPLRHKYISEGDGTKVMVEDESGRLRLTGSWLQMDLLVTGCIIAALGTENADGEFEVIDTRVADLPRQPQRWERDEIEGGKKARQKCGKIALVSGLGIGDDSISRLRLDLLTEYLLGEALGDDEQTEATAISRLIIAGDTLANSPSIPSRDEVASRKVTQKTYGYDASAYNPAPTQDLDSFLSALLPSIPITILPGATDPVNVALPQQPLHPALYPKSRAYSKLPIDKDLRVGWLDAVTNPWEGDVDGWRFLGNGGQPVDDIYKYINSEDRIQMMERILRWRVNVPTAPDTLWSFPFQEDDPYIISDCPHVFFVGNQPEFDTMVIEGEAGQSVRLIAVPKFAETGTLVLIDAETLEVDTVQFDVSGE